MSNTKVVKQCGSCRHWQGDDIALGFKECCWPRPQLPFWAYISEGMDHNNYTMPEDGKTCKTYEIKDA